MSSPADPRNPFAEGRFRDEHNPYASPEAGANQGGPYYGPRRGLVNHLTIIAILNVVQGMLELLVGGFLLIVMTLMWIDTNQATAAPPNIEVVLVMFAVLGGLAFFVAIFRFYGAYCMFTLRRRNWALAASFVGLLTVFTFYCSITSVGVAIYSLIVLFNRETADAFGMVAGGKSARETRDYYRNLPA